MVPVAVRVAVEVSAATVAVPATEVARTEVAVKVSGWAAIAVVVAAAAVAV